MSIEEETEKLKKAFADPVIKASIMESIKQIQAETKRREEARKIDWRCTCHASDFCIWHTTFS